MTGGPIVRGRCPGAHRPMMSGDGLVVRVRPRGARVSAAQALGLCALAARHGAGTLDLTNRANLQIRGVAEAAHDPLLDGLDALGLLDPDGDAETRRNILVAPFHRPGDLTARLAAALAQALQRAGDLALPAKFGFAVDAGAAPVLGDAPADIRLERAGQGGLILRADGMARGRPTTEGAAIADALALARWFVGAAALQDAPPRRMRAAVAAGAIPPGMTAAPAPACAPPAPGARADGLLLGAPFGRIGGAALVALMRRAGSPGLRVTPWRMALLERGAPAADDAAILAEAAAAGFITRPGDPLLHVDACPGAPHCAAASVETRALAARLAAHMPDPPTTLHVSGCAKGCARAAPAALTLTGRDGAFDLIRGGRASAPPERVGLSAADILAATGWT